MKTDYNDTYTEFHEALNAIASPLSFKPISPKTLVKI